MSDFGSMIRVHRKDRTATDHGDDALIQGVSKALVASDGDRLSDYADFDLRFGGSSDDNGVHGVMVGLTDYSMQDEDGNDDSLIARDAPLADRFAEELQERLGPQFKVEAYAGHW